MKNTEYLREVASICLEKLDALGIEYGIITDFSVNTRAKRRLGQCVRQNGLFTINISALLFDGSVPRISLETTIMHEILHTCAGCFNHGEAWKVMADKVNRAYGYQIKRTASYAEVGISEENIPVKKIRYGYECQGCKGRAGFSRMTNFVKDFERCPNRYHCGRCGGSLIRVI